MLRFRLRTKCIVRLIGTFKENNNNKFNLASALLSPNFHTNTLFVKPLAWRCKNERIVHTHKFMIYVKNLCVADADNILSQNSHHEFKIYNCGKKPHLVLINY